MKVAIVHEMLIKLGGAERVLQDLMHIYPEADIYTLMYDEKKVGDIFPKDHCQGGTGKIRCVGPAQFLFKITGKPRLSLPLMPLSIRMIDVSGYDLVISSSSGFAHGVKTKKGSKMYNEKCTMYNDGSSLKDNSGTLHIAHCTLKNLPVHICYCHSPARYLWDATEEVQAELGISNTKDKIQKTKWRNIFQSYMFGPLVRLLFWWLRRVDLRASKSPDLYIANSREVRGRIKKFYGRDSVVLWPPVDTLHFSQMYNVQCTMYNEGLLKNSERKFYIITSALTPFKRLDIPIRVLSKLGISLKIIGSGDQSEVLKKLAGPSIEFLGRLSDREIVQIYSHARGFLMPQKEDAGIAPIEAMAAGLPVFGQGAGGLLETNIDGVTGRFFPEETDESFERYFLQFDAEVTAGKYDSTSRMIEQAEKFDTVIFREKFHEIVEQYL